MDYHPGDQKKRGHIRHDTMDTGSRQNSCDNYININLYNKRRRRSYVDCDDFYNLNKSSEMIDVLTSRRMRILLYEKPWHSHIDPHAAVSKVNAATLSIKDQRELQEFKDEQRNIQLQMADEALNQWKMWCSSHSGQLDTSLSLKKLIDFIDSKVIPQENALLRQLAHDDHIPISGVESLLLPLLRHMCQKEENELVKKAPRSSHQQSPLMVSIRMGPQLSPHLPLSKLHNIPPLSRSSRSGRSEYVTIAEQPFTHVDSETEEEEEEVSPWMSIRSIRDRSPEGALSPSAVLDDVSCLENSLEIVSTMSAEVESLCKAAHMSTIDFSESSPYLLTDSFFTRLQKDQAKAERLGLNGTLYNSLLVEVLKEHVQLIQTLSIYMSNRVISLVPTSLTKNPTISNGLAALTSSASNTSPQTPSSINMSSSIGPKKILEGRSPETLDRDVVQSDTPFIRIAHDQDTKVKEQIRMGCQDMVVQATGPSTLLSNKSNTKSQNDGHLNKFKADENSVWLAWHRWKVGDDGSMSLEELVKCKGLDKLPSDLQSYCSIAYHLSREIERLCAEGVMLDTAVQSLEARRYLSLTTLSMILSQEWDRRCSSKGSISSSTIIQQPPYVKKIDKAFVSNPSEYASAKTVNQPVPYDFNTASTCSPCQAPPIPAEKHISRLPFASHDTPTPVTFIPGSVYIDAAYARPINGVNNTANQTATLPVAPLLTATSLGTFGSSPAMPKNGLSTSSSMEPSLRSTFEALAAVNTSTSTLGPAFTQQPAAIQDLTVSTYGKGLQTVSGSLSLPSASSTIGNIHHTTSNLSIVDPVISPTSASIQKISILANHQHTPPSSRTQSEPVALSLHGLYGSVSQAPSANAMPAPSSHPLVPVSPADIQTCFTVPIRPQLSSAPPPSQPQVLISPQHPVPSLSLPQGPASLIYFTPNSSTKTQSKAISNAPLSTGVTGVQSLPALLCSNGVTTARSSSSSLHSAKITTTQSAPIVLGPSTSASSQGIMRTSNGTVSWNASTPRSANHKIQRTNITPITISAISTAGSHLVSSASTVTFPSFPSATKQQASQSAIPTTLTTTETRTITAAATIATITPTTTVALIEAPPKSPTLIPLVTQITAGSPQAPLSATAPQQAQGAAMLKGPRVPDATTPLTPTSSTLISNKPTGLHQPLSIAATTGAGGQEQIQFFRINFDLRTVFEIWELWTLGIQGSPSVTDLIGKHKMDWLHPTDRETYRDYRSVLLTLERSVRLLKLDVRAALAQLEKVRLEFELSVRQFAKVLTEVDVGKTAPSMMSTLGSPPSSSFPISMALPEDRAAETIQAFTKAINALTWPRSSSVVSNLHS